jgi:hypothetical protein
LRRSALLCALWASRHHGFRVDVFTALVIGGHRHAAHPAPPVAVQAAAASADIGIIALSGNKRRLFAI